MRWPDQKLLYESALTYIGGTIRENFQVKMKRDLARRAGELLERLIKRHESPTSRGLSTQATVVRLDPPKPFSRIIQI